MVDSRQVEEQDSGLNGSCSEYSCLHVKGIKEPSATWCHLWLIGNWKKKGKWDDPAQFDLVVGKQRFECWKRRIAST